MPTIGGDDKVGVNLQWTVRRRREDAHDAPSLLEELGHLGPHPPMECGIAGRRPFDEEVQEVPLWHEGQEPAARRQVCEVRDRQRHLAELCPQLSDLLVR